MKNHFILKIVLLLLIFVGVQPVASLAQENNNNLDSLYTLFTNTCDSINFLTMQFLLKDSTPNLKNFHFKGIDKANPNNKKKYQKGMLYGFFKKNRSQFSKYESVCKDIEHKKQELRGKRKNCKITNLITFNTQLEALINFITRKVKSTFLESDISKLKTLLTEYKKQVISKNFSSTKNSINTISNSNEGTETNTTLNANNNPIENLENLVKQNTTSIKLLKKRINGIAELKKNKANNTFVYIVLVLSMLSLIFWIIFFISNNSKSKKQAWHQETLHFLNKTTFPHYNHALDDINNEIKSLTSKLDELKRILNLYNTRVESIQQHLEKESDSVQNTNTQNIVEKREAEIYTPVPIKRYYLPFPAPQGFFWDDKKSETESTGSLFILEISTLSSGRGKFTLNLKNEKNIKSALSTPATSLKPVCNSIDNNFSGKSIEVVEEGTLLLKEGKWSIAGGKKLTIKIV